MDVTYKHTSGKTATYTGPVYGLERSKSWARVEGPSYAAMRKPQLVDLCEKRDLDTTGTVPVLVERLEAYDAEQQSGDGA